MLRGLPECDIRLLQLRPIGAGRIGVLIDLQPGNHNPDSKAMLYSVTIGAGERSGDQDDVHR